MLDVQQWRGIADMPALDACVVEPHTHLDVFRSIQHGFVKPVDQQQVIAPARAVAAVPYFLDWRDDLEKIRHARWKNGGFQKRADAVDALMGFEPRVRKNFARLDQTPVQQGIDLPWHPDDAPADKTGRRTQFKVTLDMPRRSQTIAVDKDQVLGGRGFDGFIQDQIFLEPLVRMPQVSEPAGAKPVLPFIDRRLRRTARAIICDAHREVVHRLAKKGLQGKIQRNRIVIGGDNDLRLRHGTGKTPTQWPCPAPSPALRRYTVPQYGHLAWPVAPRPGRPWGGCSTASCRPWGWGRTRRPGGSGPWPAVQPVRWLVMVRLWSASGRIWDCGR